MEHPFTLLAPLSSRQTEAVTGAFSDSSGFVYYTPPSSLRSVTNPTSMIKPPMSTTQALGEEGGSFPPESDF